MTKYPLWIAHYGVDQPDVPYWASWSAWQYNNKGKVPGVTGNVDLNVMREDFVTKKYPKHQLLANLYLSLALRPIRLNRVTH